MSQNPNLLHALAAIRHQEKLMRENLAEGRLMPALKNCSLFLTELRAQTFSPKEYYEMYMAVFDALEGFTAYLVQSNQAKQARNKDQHTSFLPDLYELVQYSGSILPRLYLMIAVGTTCMAVKTDSTKDIMKDMMEMCRGVQHPIRGLFLRHYLSQRSKDLVPMGSMADFDDTVDFLVTNFVEMNKLWVRLQHQGHSSERALRYQERKELKILVGSNLVRLSQVVDDLESDGYSAVGYYQTKLFPIITEQIIQCKDHLAQSYLIDVVIQVFPDEFHFATLQQMLNEVFVQLHPLLLKSELVASLVDRFVNYKSNADDVGHNTQKLSINGQKTGPDVSVDSVFTAFWEFYANLRVADPAVPSDELVAILKSLVKLLLAFDASNVSNLDKIYRFAAEDLKGSSESKNESDEDMQRLWVDLLMTPIEHFASIQSLLHLPFFHKLFLNVSLPHLRKKLACDIAEKLLSDSKQKLTSPEEIDGVFRYLQVLIEEVGSQLSTSKDLGVEKTIRVEGDKLVTDGFLKIQETVSKAIHLVQHKDEYKCLSNLFYLKKRYLGKGTHNIAYSYPTLVSRMTNTLRIAGFRHLNKTKKADSSLISSNFKNISVVVDELYQQNPRFNAEVVLKLYLDLASTADQLRQENIAYELFSQCFVIYEENLVLPASAHTFNPHDSMGGSVSYQSVVMIANRLASSRFFSKTNYESLITKVTLYGSKLLKKQDQCRAIYQCAHLWWWCESLIEEKSPTVLEAVAEESLEQSEGKSEGTGGEKDEKEETAEEGNGESGKDTTNQTSSVSEAPALYQDAKRVLECLQKALRVADSCMDPYLSLKLFVEILNRCLIFNIYDNWMVDTRYIGGLIDLIRTNFANFENSSVPGVEDDQETRYLRRIEELFNCTLGYLRYQQQSVNTLRGLEV